MTTQAEVKTVTDAIGGHYARRATPEVWAEVDELRRALARIAAGVDGRSAAKIARTALAKADA